MKFQKFSRKIPEISSNFSGKLFFQNLGTVCHFLNISVKFRQDFIEISQKNRKIHRKTRMKNDFFPFSGKQKRNGENMDQEEKTLPTPDQGPARHAEISFSFRQNFWRFFAEIALQKYEIYENLVDLLEKCCKMTIWLLS